MTPFFFSMSKTGTAMRTIATGPVSDQLVLIPNELLMKNVYALLNQKVGLKYCNGCVTGPPHLYSLGMLPAWTGWHYLQHQKD